MTPDADLYATPEPATQLYPPPTSTCTFLEGFCNHPLCGVCSNLPVQLRSHTPVPTQIDWRSVGEDEIDRALAVLG